MNDDRNIEVMQFLLGEMDEVRRAEFEMRLETDPALEAAVRVAADSLAGFALAAAPGEALPQAARTELATAVLAAAPAEPTQAWLSRRGRWVWPVAAALLLGLNLWQFLRGAMASTWPASPHGSPPAAQASTVVHSPGSGAVDSLSETASVGRPATGSVVWAAADEDTERLRLALATLRHENATLLRHNTKLQAENSLLVRREERPLRSGGGLAGMELVDAERFARGERRGLVTLLQALGSKPTDGPVAIGSDGMSVAVVGVQENGPAGAMGTGSALSTTAPYAWSVFDVAQHEALIDLHQLPDVGAEETLMLWVRLESGERYRRVGEIPAALHGGSGTIFVTLDPQLTLPQEMMVTREKRGDASDSPSKSVVLRGP